MDSFADKLFDKAFNAVGPTFVGGALILLGLLCIRYNKWLNEKDHEAWFYRDKTWWGVFGENLFTGPKGWIYWVVVGVGLIILGLIFALPPAILDKILSWIGYL